MPSRVFGPVTGPDGRVISEGTRFADRATAAAAGVHRPMRAGISGSVSEGADSIVLSGGYEDDEDLGDLVVYTGQGGQDSVTKAQVHDQEFRGVNMALVVSCREGLPVRVLRGADSRSKFAPASGYRYDGLYRVDGYWQERGSAGFLMCRYRLLKYESGPRLETEASAGVDLTPGAAGTSAPVRRETLVQRIVRNTLVGREVKAMYDYGCQVCGVRLTSVDGPYAEAAHIRALGRPHNGPDVPSNILCLCPNHHVLFDLGAFCLDDDLTLRGAVSGRLVVHVSHSIAVEHIRYHRELGRAQPG